MVQLAPKQKSSDFNKICFGSNKSLRQNSKFLT